MPMSKTRRGRLRQVERWLNEKFPPSRPTYVRVKEFKRGRLENGYIWGETSRVKGKVYIYIHSKTPWMYAIDTLLHDWAHAVVWPLAAVEYKIGHTTEWAVTYGRIYEAYFDELGFIESRAYPDD